MQADRIIVIARPHLDNLVAVQSFLLDSTHSSDHTHTHVLGVHLDHTEFYQSLYLECFITKYLAQKAKVLMTIPDDNFFCVINIANWKTMWIK